MQKFALWLQEIASNLKLLEKRQGPDESTVIGNFKKILQFYDGFPGPRSPDRYLEGRLFAADM